MNTNATGGHQPIHTPDPLRIKEDSTDPNEPSTRVALAYSAQTGAYEAYDVHLDGPYAHIKGRTLRGTPLRQIVREKLPEALLEHNAHLATVPAVKTFFLGTTGRAVSKKSQRQPSTEQLQNAATVFTLARLTQNFPIRAVQRCFALEYRDAQRWVRLARRHNLLD